jgi:hypothetical protein
MYADGRKDTRVALSETDCPHAGFQIVADADNAPNARGGPSLQDIGEVICELFRAHVGVSIDQHGVFTGGF